MFRHFVLSTNRRRTRSSAAPLNRTISSRRFFWRRSISWRGYTSGLSALPRLLGRRAPWTTTWTSRRASTLTPIRASSRSRASCPAPSDRAWASFGFWWAQASRRSTPAELGRWGTPRTATDASSSALIGASCRLTSRR